MAEETLASAVSVPQPEQLLDAGQKRRQSSASESSSKRRRISDQHGYSPDDARQSSPRPVSAQDLNTTKPPRKTATATEERKRGQRLFGGLLGTLSQTSSTAAQKRRADIEQRQQAKLKLLDEQHGEAKRKKKEELVAERWEHQKQLEASSMAIRHRNLLQSANFLRTKVEPVLLWQPYQLREEDEAAIERQRQEAKDIISKEETEFDDRWREREQEQEKNKSHRENEPAAKGDTSEEPRETNQISNEERTLVSHEADFKAEEETGQRHQEMAPAGTTEAVQASHAQSTQRQEDEGEEVMEEDKEDLVLY